MPPPLRAEADPTRPVGHARIVLRGVAPGGDLGFCLLREGYAAGHLGPRGWQVGEAVLSPLEVEEEGGAPVLVLPPALVRHVEPGPLMLRLPALGRDLALFWPADIPVYDTGDDALALGGAKAPPPPAPPKPLRATSEDDDRTRVVTPPPPPPLPPPVQPRPRWPLILLVILLLAAGAGGAWWWSTREAPPVAAVPPAGPPAQPAPPPWPEGTDGLTPAEVVTRAPNPDGILAVALRRQAAGRHDDALLLFEEAADRGIAPALTALGRLYDPNGFVAGRPFTSPDMRQAADYYRRASLAGDTQVLAPREALKVYLEAAAAAGNVTAAEALREFWP